MRLVELTKVLEDIALEQPAIKTVVKNDVYRLNSMPSVEYGVFSFTQGTHRSDGQGFTRFFFTLFYVDRLTENKDNEIEAQSTGLDVLRNIVRKVEAEYCDGENSTVAFTTFTERFSDECAGAFANVEFNIADDTVCEEDY